MASKTANVTARVQPEIKAQAEMVLDQLGIPVSVLIDSLYRQIIMTKGIPYSLTIPMIPTLDTMTPAEFDATLKTGMSDAENGRGYDIDEVFNNISTGI